MISYIWMSIIQNHLLFPFIFLLQNIFEGNQNKDFTNRGHLLLLLINVISKVNDNRHRSVWLDLWVWDTVMCWKELGEGGCIGTRGRKSEIREGWRGQRGHCHCHLETVHMYLYLRICKSTYRTMSLSPGNSSHSPKIHNPDYEKT